MGVYSLTRSGLTNWVKYSTMFAGNPLPGDYELISTQVLESTASSISFTNLDTAAAAYKHLQIRANVRDNRSGYAGSNCYLRLNDAAALYAYHSLYGTGSAVGSGSATSASQIYVSDIPASGATANAFGPIIIDITDFSSPNKNKTVRSVGGTNSGYNWVNMSSGVWLSTNPVTSVTIFDSLGSFVAGSRFSLYGLRG